MPRKYRLTGEKRPPQEKAALMRAIKAAGSLRKLAEMLGITKQAVHSWMQSDRRVPSDHVVEIERTTGVPREQLRPDLYC